MVLKADTCACHMPKKWRRWTTPPVAAVLTLERRNLEERPELMWIPHPKFAIPREECLGDPAFRATQ